MHFLRDLRKSLKNNAPPAIPSNTPSWNFLQYHQLYSLQYATDVLHVSTPSSFSTSAHHPRHLRWHVTLARRLRNPRQYVTHASMPPTQTLHPRQEASHASLPPTTPTLAQIARHFSSYWVSKRKFSSFYFKFSFFQPFLFRSS